MKRLLHCQSILSTVKEFVGFRTPRLELLGWKLQHGVSQTKTVFIKIKYCERWVCLKYKWEDNKDTALKRFPERKSEDSSQKVAEKLFYCAFVISNKLSFSSSSFQIQSNRFHPMRSFFSLTFFSSYFTLLKLQSVCNLFMLRVTLHLPKKNNSSTLWLTLAKSKELVNRYRRRVQDKQSGEHAC